MLNLYIEEVLAEYRRRESAAEKRHFVSEALIAGREHTRLSSRLFVWLGRALISEGKRLQARGGAEPAPLTASLVRCGGTYVSAGQTTVLRSMSGRQCHTRLYGGR